MPYLGHADLSDDPEVRAPRPPTTSALWWRGGRPRRRRWPDPVARRIHAFFTLGDLCWRYRTEDGCKRLTNDRGRTWGSDKGKPGKRISLKLSAEQTRQIKAATGKDAVALELGVEELEQRIAPAPTRIPSSIERHNARSEADLVTAQITLEGT